MKKYLIILVVIIFLIVYFLLCPILILDKNDSSLLSGATVEYKTAGWNGCQFNSSHKTFFGIAVGLGKFSPCQITVSKEGYHINGANKANTISKFLGLRIIKLNKIQNPQPLIKFNRVFKPNTGMDVLSYLKDINPSVLPENMFRDKEDDFTFIPIGEITPESKVSGLVGDPIYKLKFNGEGGIQAVSRDDTKGSMVSLYFDLENLLIAPNSGYQKELEIMSGKGYVARLRDGKHYMVFYVEGSIMVGYIQPEESRNMEYVGLSINNSLDYNKNSSNYDLKVKYLDLKKELSGEHTIEFGNYYRGVIDAIYLKEYMGKYVFNLAPNNNRYTDIHKIVPLSSLKNVRVVVELPPFNIFSSIFDPTGTLIPIDLFFEGKYLDPTKIELN